MSFVQAYDIPTIFSYGKTSPTLGPTHACGFKVLTLIALAFQGRSRLLVGGLVQCEGFPQAG